MRVKRELNTRGVERIKGLTSKELADNCPDLRSVFPLSPCKNFGCEYAINEPGYMNCTFVASEVSEHTLEAIGEMMGITREGVRLIEVRALKKVREAWDKLDNDNTLTTEDRPPVREPELAPRENHVDSDREGTELPDERDSVPAHAGRKLAQC